MGRKKRRVSSTDVTLTGHLPDTRAMVAFLAPYARGAWHWFTLQASLAVLSILVALATPALAAVAIDQAVAGRIGWGFLGLAGTMGASALLAMASGPVTSRFGVALGGRLTGRMVAGVFDNGWFHIALLRSQASRVMELADAPAMKEGSCRAPADTLRRNIQLEDVWVHGEAHDILHGVSLEIPPGATIALVGESGVGKTTLALLGRLHDPDRGTVRIDATPVQAWSSKALAERIAYAFESPALLGDTVRDAITLGYDADDAEVEAAARRVEADAFIRRLPKGYGTCLDETPMSGGERQRLGLARAALRDSPALVLDDALSSLDVATAGRVFAALGSLSQDRTAIIVAHRASTAATADLVAWLVDGRIERVATHADLWDDPAYRAAFVVTERDSAVDSAVVEDG